MASLVELGAKATTVGLFLGPVRRIVHQSPAQAYYHSYTSSVSSALKNQPRRPRDQKGSVQLSTD